MPINRSGDVTKKGKEKERLTDVNAGTTLEQFESEQREVCTMLSREKRVDLRDLVAL